MVVDRIERCDHNLVEVGIGEFAVSKSPSYLVTWSLGSCLAIILYDRKKKVGGLAHVLLPKAEGRGDNRRGMFVDTAVCDMMKEMRSFGSQDKDVVAALIGGATITGFGREFAIGRRNVIAAREVLSDLAIPIVEEEVGGNRGRSVSLNLRDGVIYVEFSKPPMFLASNYCTLGALIKDASTNTRDQRHRP